MIFTLLVYFAYQYLLANSVDPYQMQHFVASELGVRCLHITPKQVSGLERVK